MKLCPERFTADTKEMNHKLADEGMGPTRENRLSGTSEQAGFAAKEKRRVRTVSEMADASNEAGEGFKDCDRECPIFSSIQGTFLGK